MTDQGLRIALIGKTGVGKSALGNTLLGERKFESKAAGESVTKTSQVEAKRVSDRMLKVVDTPGVLDTGKCQREIKAEVEKAMKALSPGPSAILIVLSPARYTKEERQVLEEVKKLFDGDDSFLHFSILVFVRRNEIRDDDDELMDIHKFIASRAPNEVQELYRKCGKRAVAVENMGSKAEKQMDAANIMEAIDGLGGGYYDHAYFEIQRLQRALDDKWCNIL